MHDTDTHATLADYRRIIVEQRWVILLTTVLCVAVAIGLSLQQPHRYTATAQLDYTGDTESLDLVGAPSQSLQTTKELADLGQQTLLQPQTLAQVQRQLRTTTSIAALRADVSTSVDPNSNLVSVTATSSNPQFSAKLANALAQATVAGAASTLRAQYTAAAQNLRLREQTLGHGPAGIAQAELYSEQITRFEALANIASPVSLVKPATVDTTPTSPQPARNAVIAGVLGLLLGLLAAFLRDSRDRRVRGAGEVRRALDAPVIGHVRERALGAAGRLTGSVTLEAADVEGFKIVRANLRFLGANEPRAIAVTSAGPGEGKSTTAASLALACASAGQRTLLVEGDLRRPALAARLDLDADAPGLTDCLLGHSDWREATQACAPAFLASANGFGPLPEAARPTALTVLLAGEPTDRPAELLGSHRFRELVEEWRDAFDQIVFDTCPLLTVADTLELLPLVDASLLCVRAEQTTRPETEGVARILGRVPHGPIALVITGVKRGRESGYEYYSPIPARQPSDPVAS